MFLCLRRSEGKPWQTCHVTGGVIGSGISCLLGFLQGREREKEIKMCENMVCGVWCVVVFPNFNLQP